VGEATSQVDPHQGERPESDDRPDYEQSIETDDSENLDPEVAAEIEQKREDIEHTRSELTETVEAIQERLNPQRLVDEAKETVREATIGKAEQMAYEVGERVRETRMSFMDTIRENPVPAALAAIGLGWLWTKRSHSSSYGWGADYERSRRRIEYSEGWGTDYERRQHRGPMRQAGHVVSGAAGQAGHVVGGAAGKVGDVAGNTASKVGDVAGQAASKVGHVAGDVKDTAGELAEATQERLSEFGTGAQHQARRAQDWYQHNLQENPLVVGAAAMVVGAAIGLALPETQREAELMGDARDRLMDKAKEVAHEAGDRVQQAVKETADTAGASSSQSTPGVYSQTPSASL
jgi:ElaB/YqjD/DUF883 family membrane-anchored ribosome-binding protein